MATWYNVNMAECVPNYYGMLFILTFIDSSKKWQMYFKKTLGNGKIWATFS